MARAPHAHRAQVEATKPLASRNESAEIFVVCSRFTSAKIDPRLFDPKCVFSDLTELRAANALQTKVGYKAPALGYEKGDLTLYHTAPVVDFVRSEQPIRVLSEKSALIWPANDAACAFYDEQIATTDEARARSRSRSPPRRAAAPACARRRHVSFALPVYARRRAARNCVRLRAARPPLRRSPPPLAPASPPFPSPSHPPARSR